MRKLHDIVTQPESTAPAPYKKEDKPAPVVSKNDEKSDHKTASINKGREKLAALMQSNMGSDLSTHHPEKRPARRQRIFAWR